MGGLVPAIHAVRRAAALSQFHARLTTINQAAFPGVDGRDKPGHDAFQAPSRARYSAATAAPAAASSASARRYSTGITFLNLGRKVSQFSRICRARVEPVYRAWLEIN